MEEGPKKRRRTVVWSLGRGSLDSQHLLNLPLEFPSPRPGHCEEPPPWEHEREPLKRVYHFTLGQTVHYQCAQGFRALQTGPAESTCMMINGELRWTRPRLKCIREGEHGQASGRGARAQGPPPGCSPEAGPAGLPDPPAMWSWASRSLSWGLGLFLL